MPGRRWAWHARSPSGWRPGRCSTRSIAWLAWPASISPSMVAGEAGIRRRSVGRRRDSGSPSVRSRSCVCIAAGWTNQEIADALFISRKTASVHASHIFDKLGAANRAEAGAMAHRLGLGGGTCRHRRVRPPAGPSSTASSGRRP